jgi:hypothetical protein
MDEGCLAVAERPVLAIDRHQADHDVLSPDDEPVVQLVDNLLVEAALLLFAA